MTGQHKGERMKLHTYIQKLRAYPEKFSLRSELLFSLGVLLLGLIFSIGEKATEGVFSSGIWGGDIGIRVFLAVLISAYSRYPISAAVNSLLFFLPRWLICSPYEIFWLEFFSRNDWLGWLIIVGVTFLTGFGVWFSKGKGVLGSVFLSLPAAILFSGGFQAFYSADFMTWLLLLLWIALLLILPKTLKQKLVAFALSILFVTVPILVRLLPYFFLG